MRIRALDESLLPFAVRSYETRGRELPRTFSTYVHAPARTEPA